MRKLFFILFFVIPFGSQSQTRKPVPTGNTDQFVYWVLGTLLVILIIWMIIRKEPLDFKFKYNHEVYVDAYEEPTEKS